MWLMSSSSFPKKKHPDAVEFMSDLPLDIYCTASIGMVGHWVVMGFIKGKLMRFWRYVLVVILLWWVGEHRYDVHGYRSRYFMNVMTSYDYNYCNTGISGCCIYSSYINSPQFIQFLLSIVSSQTREKLSLVLFFLQIVDTREL